MPPLQRREHVFLVRLWREPSGARRAGWRGSAHHAASGRRFYFASLAQLKRYLHDELGIDDEPIETGTLPPAIAVHVPTDNAPSG